MNIHQLKNQSALKVGYVMVRMPTAADTGALDELVELERQGIEVEIYALSQPEGRENDVNEQVDENADGNRTRALKAPTILLPTGSLLRDWQLGIEPCDSGRFPAEAEALGTQRQDRNRSLFAGVSKAEAMTLWMQAGALAMLAASRGIQHLHVCWGADAATVTLLASRMSRIPYSYRVAAEAFQPTATAAKAWEARCRDLIAEASVVLAASDYDRMQLERIAGEEFSAKIHRLYPGVDLMRFRPSNAKRVNASFLSVGCLDEQQGYFHLVEACRRLFAHGHDFSLTILGEGPEQDSLQRQIEVSGLRHHIHLTGAIAQDQACAMMRRASVLVLPGVAPTASDPDSVPNSLLQAMAMSLPAITTRIAGISEIVDQGRTGLLVPAADSKRLAEAMQVLIENPDQRELMGRNGRRKAEQRFDVRKNVARLRSYFAHSVDLSTSYYHDTANPERFDYRHSAGF